MAYCRAIICFYSYFMMVIATIGAKELCDERKCRIAPLTHYHSLRCTPEYDANDCCPIRYNCDHMYERIHRRHNTCYINKNEYAIGVKLRKEDSVLCEENCTCVDKYSFADFECTIPKDQCFSYKPSRPKCYLENPIQQCCPTEEVCSDEQVGNDICEVHEEEGNKIYFYGEYVRTKAKLEKGVLALCEGNATGHNREYTLSTIDYNRWYDLHAAAGFYNNCAPVYTLDIDGLIGIRRKIWRCQVSNDYIHLKSNVKKQLSAMHCPAWRHCKESPMPCRLINPEGPQNITYNFKYREVCRLGQMVMEVDDEAMRVPYLTKHCIVCVCEVPPVPTCILHENAPCFEHYLCSGKNIVAGGCRSRSAYYRWLIIKGYKT